MSTSPATVSAASSSSASSSSRKRTRENEVEQTSKTKISPSRMGSSKKNDKSSENHGKAEEEKEAMDGGNGGEDEEDMIDAEQLDEYGEMLEELGTFAVEYVAVDFLVPFGFFALFCFVLFCFVLFCFVNLFDCCCHRLLVSQDKVAINSLSMVAEDFASSSKSASAIYKRIRDLLISPTVSPDRKLPLVYVIDSILKNVKGSFISVIESDAKHWMPVVFADFSDERKTKLRKVWNTWRDFAIFQSQDSWHQMGRCFEETDAKIKAAKLRADGIAKAAGIARSSDGTLQLSPTLRSQMQSLLDEAQSTGVNELDKVSLERLADINPTLLVEIKNAAQQILGSAGLSSSSNPGQPSAPNSSSTAVTSSLPLSSSSSLATSGNANIQPISQYHYLHSLPPDEAAISAEWANLNLDYFDLTNVVVSTLHRRVREGSRTPNHAHAEQKEQSKEHRAIHLLASASAAASHLTDMLERLKVHTQKEQRGDNDDETTTNNPFLIKSSSSSSSSSTAPKTFIIDSTLFTTEGVKKKNQTVISTLYDAGLPFVSSSDGRRFATQIQLSRHLDQLFQRSQVEKTMERADERGWYSAVSSWTGIGTAQQGMDGTNDTSAGNSATNPTTSLSSTNATNANNPNNTMPSAAAAAAAAGGTNNPGALFASDTAAMDESTTVLADETRDRCAICAINFTMFFDQDDGEWKYKNCREIKVLNDDAAEKEFEWMLVHLTCLRGLGSPDTLSADQVVLHHY